MKPSRLAALPLALLPCLAGAAGSDELWEITTRLEDRTSGFVMAPTTQRQCLRQDAATDQVVPLDKGCRLLDQQTSGATVTFRFECLGAGRLAGIGELDRPDGETYRGRMQMRGTGAQGRPVDVAVAFAGRRIGGCDADPPPAAAN